MPRLLDDREHARKNAAETAERRNQVLGLLLLALIALVFTILRAGPHRIFTHGWWRLW